MSRKHAIQVLALCTSSLVGSLDASIADEISFKDRFQKAEKQTVVTIQANPTDVLVVEPGTYTLNGRRLIVSAKQISLPGDALIESFDAKDTPPTKPGAAPIGSPPSPVTAGNCGGPGCDGASGSLGKTGDDGTNGASAEDFSINVEEIDGAGVLTLVTKGQTGGKGQKGGKGGTGQQGGHGAQRSCGGALGLDTRAGPGRGGVGGQGGTGGFGGQGGLGGASGSVLLRDNLFNSLALRKLVIDTSGGDGGAGGDPGERGDPGLGNDGGAGASCGGGGPASGSGNPGEPGHQGFVGRSGRPGAVLFSRFNGEDPTELPPGVTKVEKEIRVSVDEAQGRTCPVTTVADEICVDEGRSIAMSRAVQRVSLSVSYSNVTFAPIPNRPRCVAVTGTVSGSPSTRVEGFAFSNLSVMGFPIGQALSEAIALAVPGRGKPFCTKAEVVYLIQVLTVADSTPAFGLTLK